MPSPHASGSTSGPQPPKVVDLLHDIERDMKTIATGELELVRSKLTTYIDEVVTRASVAVLGAIVALIGLGMLCTVVVVALAPVLPALWLRLLIMACAYIAIGAGAAMLYGKRLAAERAPDLSGQVDDLEHAVDSVERGISH